MTAEGVGVTVAGLPGTQNDEIDGEVVTTLEEETVLQAEPVNAAAGVDGQEAETTHRAKLQCVTDSKNQKQSKAGVLAKQASEDFMHGKFPNMGAAESLQLVSKYFGLVQSGESGDLGEDAEEVKPAGAKWGWKSKSSKSLREADLGKSVSHFNYSEGVVGDVAVEHWGV
jgi:hypothetical protein